MKSSTLLIVVAAGGLAAAFAGIGCTRSLAGNKAEAAAAQLEHGRYLVERVGLCIDCHSPRLPDGSYDKDHWLGGAPLPFAPTVPMPAWAEVAPPLAGVIAGYTDAEAVRLLEGGPGRLGTPPRPPMPHFQMTRGDAECVVIYLRSLGAKKT